MLTTLTAASAQTPSGREWGSRSASLALHLGLIALAVWWTQAPPPPVAHRHDDPLVFFGPAPHHASTAPSRPTGAVALPQPFFPMPVATPTLPPIDAPPAPGWPPVAVDPFPGAPGPAYPAAVGPPSPPPPAPMDVRTVEEPPVLLSHPVPGYPELLRRAGIAGRVVVEVVLDTTGRAERGSLRVVSSTHGLFVSEASALVLGSVYRPARFGGMAVRVRVQVPVEFVVRR